MYLYSNIVATRYIVPIQALSIYKLNINYLPPRIIEITPSTRWRFRFVIIIIVNIYIRPVCSPENGAFKISFLR